MDRFAGVTVSEIYPGIDIDLHGPSGLPRIDFRISPGADPCQIRLALHGADSVTLGPDGALVISIRAGSLRLAAPAAFQPRSWGDEPVAVAYALSRDGTIGFELGAWDPSAPLIIDPTLSPLPTPHIEIADVATDTAGNVYTYGSLPNPPRPATGFGSPQLYVAKVEAETGRLLYWTYFGSNLSGVRDVAGRIAVADDGSAFVTGTTSSINFPIVRPVKATLDPSGWGDAFVTQIAPSGTSLLFSTYLGGSGADAGAALAVDAAGNVLVLGRTASADFPTTPGAWDRGCGTDDKCNPGPGGELNPDLFVAKIDPVAGTLVWATYLGGWEWEFPAALAVDGEGRPVVNASTYSFDYPTTDGALDRQCGDTPFHCSRDNGSRTRDVVITKLDAHGTTLDWSTFFGGGGEDVAYDMVLEATGGVAVGGTTLSTTLPTPGGFQTAPGSAFVARLAGDGGSLLFCTYLGSQGLPGEPIGVRDWIRRVAVGSSGHLWIRGETTSQLVPLVNPLRGFDEDWTRGAPVGNGYLALLPPGGGTPVFSTFIGGIGTTLASAPGGAVALAGYTAATVPPAVLRVANDGLLADLRVVMSQDPPSVRSGLPVDYVATVHNDGPDAATGVALSLGGLLTLYPEPSQGSCRSWKESGFDLCSLGTIPAGGSAIVRTRRTASTGDTTMRAAVESWVGDPHPESNLSELDPVVVPLPALKLTSQLPSPSELAAGQGLPLAFRVANLGPSEARSARLGVAARLLTDSGSPPRFWNVDFSDVTVSTGSCSASASAETLGVSCDFGDLAPGAEVWFAGTAWGVVPGTLEVSATVQFDVPLAENPDNHWASSVEIVSPYGPGATWFVPGIAHNPGHGGTQWRSDLALVNPGPTATTATITFVTPSGEDARSVQVAAGQQRAWWNVLESLFALAPDQAAAGSLRISSPSPLAIAARTYNLTPGGTLGQELPAVRLENGLTRGKPAATLVQLRKGLEFRSNLGAVNLSAVTGVLVIRLRDADGSDTGKPIRLEVPASGWAQQFDVLAAAGAGSQAVATAAVTVDTPGIALWPYASLVDAATGDPTTLAGENLGTSGTGCFSLSTLAAHAPGVNATQWRTDVAVLNPMSWDQTAVFTYQTDTRRLEREAPLRAGEAREWGDVLTSLFGLPTDLDESGILSVRTKDCASNPDALRLAARIYNQTSTGTYGQSFPFVGLTAAVSSGDKAVLPMLRASSEFRSNVGFLPLWIGGASSAEVRLTLHDADGSVLGSPRVVTLPLDTVIQKTDVFAFVGAPARDQAYATVELLSPNCLVYAYGSIVDNRTGDPTTVVPILFKAPS